MNRCFLLQPEVGSNTFPISGRKSGFSLSKWVDEIQAINGDTTTNLKTQLVWHLNLGFGY
jgi:hypothetical protein